MSKRFSYTTAFKLQVVDFAKTNGNRITARHFGVDESNVRLWKKSKLQLDKMPKRANRGRIAFYPNLEKQIIEWITDCRSQGIALNTIQICLKAKLYAKDMNIVDFKASTNWCYRFMARHDLSIRRKTHISQKLPDDYEDKIIAFQTHIIKRRKILNPPLSLIGNADQTPLTFDLPADSTIEKKGTQSLDANMPRTWSPSLNGSSTAGKHLINRFCFSFKRCCISNAMDGTEDDILWNEEATCQEEEAQSDDDDEDDLLFNDEDIMSTEQIQQLFMESDDEDFLGFE